jgi:Fe-S-cluster containining protein
MKKIDSEDIDRLPGVRIEDADTFSFRCYPGIGCFNRCCRNLNLFLYPYDVLRLKNALGITSDAFLDKYVDVVLRPGNYFPEVLLRMSEDDEKSCPFLTPSGCSVYPERPDTCRTFPIEQGILYDADTKKDVPIYLYRPPEFCLGQYENDEWTLSTWAGDQDAGQHHKMTIRWAEIKRLFQTDPCGQEGRQGSKAKMAFMAVYNVDQFRDFVFQSSFLRRYKVKTAMLKKLKADDVDLLKFGFEWVKFFLWGIQSKHIRMR